MKKVIAMAAIASAWQALRCMNFFFWCVATTAFSRRTLETATRCLGLAWVLAKSWGHHDPLSHLCRRGVLPLAALHDTLTCTPAGCRQPEPLGSTGGDSEVYHMYSSEIRIVYHLYTIRSPW